MAATPAAANASTTEDYVATFLLKEGLFLTALELHAELSEEGRVVPQLADFFNNPSKFPEPQHFISPTENTRARQNFDSIYSNLFGGSALQGGAKQHKGKSPSKDERNAVLTKLQYELRISQEDNTSLKARVSELNAQVGELELFKQGVLSEAENNSNAAAAPSGKKNKNNNNNNNNNTNNNSKAAQATAAAKTMSGAGLKDLVADLAAEPVKDFERRTLNCLVKRYLVDNGYRLTAMTLSDEVEGQDLDDLADVGLQGPSFAGLHVLQRYWRKRPMRSTQELDAELQSSSQEKDKYLEEIERVKRGAESRVVELEGELSKIHDTIEAQKREIITLMTDLRAAREENEFLVKNAGKVKAALAAQEEQENEKAKAEAAAAEAAAAQNPSAEASAKELGLEKALRRRRLARTAPDQIARDRKDLAERMAEIMLKQDTVSVVASSLPNIVPHVLLNKREELVPVILTVIRQHTEAPVRDSLMNMLFNLIKKPDEFQRATIMDGCVALARSIGPVRTETELLPQCWEQITHKHAERRVLVADSCGSLAPFVRSEMRGSFLLSIMQQLLDDKSPLVRAAVAKNMGLLITSIEADEKYTVVEECAVKLLFDTAPQVVAATRDFLLPRLAEWANEIASLWTMLVPTIIGQLEALVSSPVAFSPFGATEGGGSDRAISLAGALVTLVPLLRSVVLLSAGDIYESGTRAKDAQGLSQLSQGTEPPTEEDLARLQVVFDKFVNVTDPNMTSLSLPALDWLACSFVPRLISVASHVDTAIENAVTAIRELFQTVCRAFGPLFTKLVVKPLFMKIIEGSPHASPLDDSSMLLESPGPNTSAVSEGHQENARLNEQRTRLLPIFVTGVIADLDEADLSRSLMEIVVAMTPEDRASWGYKNIPLLSQGLVTLAQGDDILQNSILNTLRDLQLHQSPAIRGVAAMIQHTFVKVLGRDDIAKRVVPSLITLAGDTDSHVRLLSIPALAAVLTRLQDPQIHEKIRAVLEAFVTEVKGTPRDVIIALIRAFSTCVGAVDSRFRDNFIAPKLHEIANEMGLRRDIAPLLYECMRSFNGCSVGPEAASHLLAILKLLGESQNSPLGATERANMQHMIKDIQGTMNDNADKNKRGVTNMIARGMAGVIGYGGDKKRESGIGATSSGSGSNLPSVPTMSMDSINEDRPKKSPRASMEQEHHVQSSSEHNPFQTGGSSGAGSSGAAGHTTSAHATESSGNAGPVPGPDKPRKAVAPPPPRFSLGAMKNFMTGGSGGSGGH